MRRSLAPLFVARLALALTLAPLGVARAQEAPKDDFVWKPLEKRAPVAGDRWFQEESSTDKKASRAQIPGKPLQRDDRASALSFRLVHEVQAVDGAKVTKEKVSVERWRMEVEGQPADTSLEGKTLLVEGAGQARKATVEGGKESAVSEAARSWIDQDLLKKGSNPDADDSLLPRSPVKEGGTWTPDLKRVADDLLGGEEIDDTQSSAKGTLTEVKVEDGLRVGHLEIVVKVKLKNVPGTGLPWTEGGLLEMRLHIDTSLEPMKSRRSSTKAELKLAGKSESEEKAASPGPPGEPPPPPGPAKEGLSLSLSLDRSLTAKEGELPAGSK